MASTTATRKQSEAIRHRMQQIRNELPYDVDAARARVHQLTDWKYHAKKHPWPILAAAAVAGYALVPAANGKQTSHSGAASRRQSEPAEPAQKGVIGGLVAGAVTFAIRSGLSMATRYASDALMNRSQGQWNRAGDSQHTASPSYPR